MLCLLFRSEIDPMTSSKQPCWACSTKVHLKKTYIFPLEMDGTDAPDNIFHLCDLYHRFLVKL